MVRKGKKMENNTVGVTQEELINWLNENSGRRAGISAADGIISIFDLETGESGPSINVDQYLSDDKVTIKFIGKDRKKAADLTFTNLIDGGLDQIIWQHLDNMGLNVDWGDWNEYTRTQIFETK